MMGLQVIFHEPLYLTGSGVDSGGAVFPFEYLETCYPTEGRILLRRDYKVFQSLRDDKIIVFQSDAPNTPQIWVHPKLIKSIKDLTNDNILFPKSKTG